MCFRSFSRCLSASFHRSAERGVVFDQGVVFKEQFSWFPWFLWILKICQGQTLAVWILAAKLPNSHLKFAVDFWVDFSSCLFQGKRPKKSNKKSTAKFTREFRKIPLEFLQKPSLENLILLQGGCFQMLISWFSWFPLRKTNHPPPEQPPSSTPILSGFLNRDWRYYSCDCPPIARYPPNFPDGNLSCDSPPKPPPYVAPPSRFVLHCCTACVVAVGQCQWQRTTPFFLVFVGV